MDGAKANHSIQGYQSKSAQHGCFMFLFPRAPSASSVGIWTLQTFLEGTTGALGIC